jgi:hypothetical protein
MAPAFPSTLEILRIEGQDVPPMFSQGVFDRLSALRVLLVDMTVYPFIHSTNFLQLRKGFS